MSFFDRSEVVPIRSQKVPQNIETPVTFVPVPGAYVRYAYSRSSDSMASGGEGQDYLCFQHNDQKLVFIVCDGVGSSFCGNLAARILGDSLLEWLWSADITYLGGPAALGEAASSALNRLQKQAKHEVEEYQIPGQMSALVRQALEGQRAYGSEAVFVACRVDHPSMTIPDGLISVLWMGDTQLHVFGADSEFDLGGPWDNSNRWSTTQGVRGVMGAWMHELDGVERVIAFTDGLAAHAKHVTWYSDDTLDREIRAGARLPTSDDVAVIDIKLRTPEYEGYPDLELPDPNLERPRLEQIWNPTGAASYELRWNWSGQPGGFVIQEGTNPALSESKTFEVNSRDNTWKPEHPQKPGHYYYRLRALPKRGEISPWSEMRQTRVAYPPPPAPVLHAISEDAPTTLSWEGQGEALDFALEESTTADFTESEVVYTGRNATWSLPIGYKPGTYYYRVQAISDGGAGPWSKPLEMEMRLPPPPTPHLAAASYLASGRPNAFELRWQPVPGAIRYELEEINEDSEESRLIETNETTWRVDEQPVGHYSYRVRACHDSACSEWSNEQVVVVSPQSPQSAPQFEAGAADSAGAIQLRWDVVESATEYVIEVSDSDAFRNARVHTTVTTELDIIRRDPGTLFLRMCATNDGGSGPWSAPVKITIMPDAPAWIETNPEADGKLTVSWGAVGGRVTYRLQAADSGQEFKDVYQGQETQISLTVREKPPQLRVRTEAADLTSEWTASEHTATSTLLQTPVLKPAVIDSNGGVQLEWTPSAAASHYLLEAAKDDHFRDVRNHKIDRNEATFNPPVSGTYWFRVHACQGDTISEPSNIVSVEVRRPTTPHLWPVDTTSSGSLFDVVWSGVPGCTYYELQIAGDSTFSQTPVATRKIFHPSQKMTINDLKPGRYYFRVRAFDASDEVSMWSNVISVDIR